MSIKYNPYGWGIKKATKPFDEKENDLLMNLIKILESERNDYIKELSQYVDWDLHHTEYSETIKKLADVNLKIVTIYSSAEEKFGQNDFRPFKFDKECADWSDMECFL